METTPAPAVTTLSIPAGHLHTRLLYPFFLQRRCADQAVALQLLRPHPADPAAQPASSAKVAAAMPPAPAPEAPFSERLGAAGGAFRLDELITFLLAPLEAPPLDLTAAQSQFSTYTVVRFPAAVDFRRSDNGRRLGRLLSGLAQVEERQHAGAPEDDLLIVHERLNRKQWVAVSYLGAAHIVADQAPEPGKTDAPFKEERLQVSRDRYFIPYLLALLQRLTLQCALMKAGRVARSTTWDDSATVGQLRAVREDLLDFAVYGDFLEISSRDAVNRYYHLAQRAFRVEPALERVRRAIADSDASQTARRQEDSAQQRHAIARELQANVGRVAAIQSKIEWLEVFIVSFYAAELAYLIGDVLPFRQPYNIIAWAVGAAAVSTWGLKPWRHDDGSHPTGKRRSRLLDVLLALMAVVALWGIVGWWRFLPKNDHEAPPAPHRLLIQPNSNPPAPDSAEGKSNHVSGAH